MFGDGNPPTIPWYFRVPSSTCIWLCAKYVQWRNESVHGETLVIDEFSI